MNPLSQKLTVDEFTDYAATHGRCELIRGEVRHMTPAGARHGDITSRLHYFICRHVYESDLGKVYAAETGFRFIEDGEPTVRAPDIAYIAKARTAAADTSRFSPIAPDLAVETLSPDDRASEAADKIAWWLDKGVRLVWIVDPDTRTVTTHHPDGRTARLTRDQTLTAEDVLPGFSLALRDLFVD